MLLKKPITRLQWAQLYALTFIHIIADMFAGAIAPIIPAIRSHFALSLTKSLSLITICYLCCNLFQVLLGHIRPDKKRPFLLPIGLLIISAICFIVFIPVGRYSYFLLILVMAITGCGVAITHPESLRALHNLKRTPPSLGTAIYFNGGHIGFAAGSLTSALAVQYLGLAGLLIMTSPIVLCIILIYALHIRLSVERPHKIYKQFEETYSFWLLFAMAIPITISATVLPALLPTALAEMGFKLSYGGLPAVMISIGIVTGTFFWMALSKRVGQLNCVITAETIAVPLIIIYMLFIKNSWAAVLLVPVGFCGVAGYTLIVNMARHSRNLVLGQRMGIIVGGTWGLAAAALVLIGPIADRVGTVAVLNFIWTGFGVSAIIGLAWIFIKKRR